MPEFKGLAEGCVFCFGAASFKEAVEKVAEFYKISFPIDPVEYAAIRGEGIFEADEQSHPIYPGVICKRCGIPMTMVSRDQSVRRYNCFLCHSVSEVDCSTGWQRTECPCVSRAAAVRM
ncbi:MAG: hypothetical protein ACM3KM_04015 [Acidobacteriaceae bacterium]